MLRVVPALLAAAVYMAFQKYVVHRKLESKKLVWEALSFALITHVVMWVWRHWMGYEGMTTFGDKCPNGHMMVADPVNAQQQTCVPVGHATEPPTTGFQQPKA